MDPFVASDRSAAFKSSAQTEKAQRMLDEIDRACRMLDQPIPCGQSGVERIGELSASAMLQVRWAAKLKDPPSFETFGELFRLIKERG